MVKINFLIKTEKLKNILSTELKNYFSDYNIPYELYNHSSETQPNDVIIHFVELLTDKEIVIAKKLIKQFGNSSVIFISNREDLVFESLTVHPLQFIRWSKFKNDLNNAKKAILNYIEKNDTVLSFKSGTSIIYLNTKTIEYIESYGHYLFIHCVHGKHRVRDKIASVMERINNKIFIRTHKSYLINPIFISEFYHNKVVLMNKKEIPIGRIYKDDFIEKYKYFESRGEMQ